MEYLLTGSINDSCAKYLAIGWDVEEVCIHTEGHLSAPGKQVKSIAGDDRQGAPEARE
jgi:hypothetical protein